MFSHFRRKKSDMRGLYDLILDQSLSPHLYRDYGVPDTPHGRFQMITLHAAPYITTMMQSGKEKEAQALFDLIFHDIEDSFRQIGVGDLAVPKRMKRYMNDFHGIIRAHAEAQGDHAAITARNLYGEDKDANALLPAFQTYIERIFQS